jgi:hypothetical protein
MQHHRCRFSAGGRLWKQQQNERHDGGQLAAGKRLDTSDLHASKHKLDPHDDSSGAREH